MSDGEVTFASDICTLPLARRLAAMLDRDPDALREGDPLPHGWHAMLFNAPTRQSQLRADGAADLGVPLPDIGLPRLMLGGRQNRFAGDIPIGARVKRETRRGEVQLKEGRSGRFALVQLQHRIFVDGRNRPAVVEHLDYVLRPIGSSEVTAAAHDDTRPRCGPLPAASRTLLPDERLLFRYSAITDNPHRIHYDQAYATQREGYSGLVVNGSIPALFLLEMFRQHTGREPASFCARNLTPMLCNQPLTLNLLDGGHHCRLWAQDAQGTTMLDARAE